MNPHLLNRFMEKSIRFILTSVLLTSFWCLFPAITIQAASVDLDTSFGSDGIVTTSVSAGEDNARGIAIQEDGKILIAGVTDYDIFSSGEFAVVRYNTDGTLDTNFGTDGMVVTTSVSDGIDQVSDIAIQDNGKILVAGTADYVIFGASGDFAVVRYNTDGSLDTSFGTDGIVTTSVSDGSDGAGGVSIQSDGMILVAGYAGGEFAVVRYNTDGTLDTNFGTDGMVTTNISSGEDYGYGVAIQADGKILVSGSANYFSDNTEFALVRYNTDGSLDTSFGTDGIVTTSVSDGHDRASGFAIQADGKILVAGNAGADFAIVRYNTDGTLDTNFGTDGIVTTSVSYGIGHAGAIAIQADSKILMTGGAGGDFAIVRYNTDGSLDTSFGIDGMVTTSVSDGDYLGGDIAIQADGRILVAGKAGGDFVVVRYAAYSSFSVDGITIKSSNSTISNVASPDIPAGAPSGFTASDCVSFTATDVYTNAAIFITFPSLPEVVYKTGGGDWQEIYPTNESSCITNVSMDGNTLTFTIADNSYCDEDDSIGTINDPIVAGSFIGDDGGDTAAGGDGEGDGCFIATAR